MSFLSGREFGSKTGSGGDNSAQAQMDRRERLRLLALETIDLNKDPYFMKNHLGTYECKLCLTLHRNEGSYLAHTQGKRHQQNLARRAAREAQEAPVQPEPYKVAQARVQPRKTAKIGRPGYKVTKQKDPDTAQHSLLFQLYFPDISDSVQPRHRIMSAFEQRVEPRDDKFQYLLFAAEPYETVAFKIPNKEIDRGEGRFFSHWDRDKQVYTLQLFFKERQQVQRPAVPALPVVAQRA